MYDREHDSTTSAHSDKESTQLLRNGIDDYSLIKLDEPVTIDRSKGLEHKVLQAYPRHLWKFNARIRRQIDLMKVRPEDLIVPNSQVIVSTEDRLAVLNIARDLANLTKRYHDENLTGRIKDHTDALMLASEYEVAKKICGQWIIPVGSHLEIAGVQQSLNSQSKEKLAKSIRHVLEDYYADYGADIEPDPADTNPGWPFFKTSPYVKIITAATSDLTPGQAREICYSTGAPIGSEYAFGWNYRFGPTSKSSYIWKHIGQGRWRADFKVVSAAPRIRKVWMAPYAATIELAPLAGVLKQARKRIAGLWHEALEDRELITRALREFEFIYEADMSGYDQHFCLDHKDVIASCLRERYPKMKDLVNKYLYYDTRSTISPSWALDETLDLYVEPNTLHSGIRLTSEIGSLVNFSLQIATISELFKRSVKNGRDVLILIQGDDTLIFSKVQIDPEAYKQIVASYGFETELKAGDKFLMRHRLTIPDTPVCARIIQQTCFHERERTGLDSVGILLLGLAERAAGLEQNQKLKAYESVDAIVPHVHWLRELNLTSIAAAREFAKKEEGKALIRKSLDSVAGKSYIAQILHDAPYSPSAKAILDEIEVLKPELVNQATAMDKFVEEKARQIRRLDRRDKLKLLNQTAVILDQGLTQEEEDALLLSLIKNYT